MQRKQFITSLLAPAVGCITAPLGATASSSPVSPILPPPLKKGDTIGITSSAGFITVPEVGPAVKMMEGWGFQVRLGKTIGRRDFSFGGTDEERAGDLQQLLNDPTVKAIMIARGGYGMVRIIDRIDFSAFVKKPKWVIGFSDVTLLHTHINSAFQIASIHSKMCNSFPGPEDKVEPGQMESIASIRDALTGTVMRYTAPSHDSNRKGITEGRLVGGNLKMIETASGTPSDLRTDGCILFLEDTGEYLYSIDRMFCHLERTGKLERLKGLVIGGFRIKPDDPGEEFGRQLTDIVLEKVKNYNYPVCFNFPVGHQKVNMALKCGAKHRLSVTVSGSELQELTA